MPFFGVQRERQALFQPEPRSDVGVNDAHAWRLNPAHRHVYNKLELALRQGIVAAPLGVDPAALGVDPQAELFVKPITNLFGMSRDAGVWRADALPDRPGCFWSRRLQGRQTSTDCLVRDGELLWMAHTRASDLIDRARPVFWRVGVECREIEAALSRLIARELAAYTGLCNVEMIDGVAIEMHLRGSNGFFDFYAAHFFASWVGLVDTGRWVDPGRIPGGTVASWFGSQLPDEETLGRIARNHQVSISPDRHSADRIAIIRGHDHARVLQALEALQIAFPDASTRHFSETDTV